MGGSRTSATPKRLDSAPKRIPKVARNGLSVRITLSRTPSSQPWFRQTLLVAITGSGRVEDTADFASALVPVLESLGCTVTGFDRAERAFEFFEESIRAA